MYDCVALTRILGPSSFIQVAKIATRHWPEPLRVPADDIFEDAAGNLLDEDIPVHFKCPISHSLMLEPTLVTSSGQSYERKNITRWVEEHHTDPTSPSQTLNVDDLIPNTALRGLIEDYITRRVQEAGTAAGKAAGQRRTGSDG